jgi:hypothetical protein
MAHDRVGRTRSMSVTEPLIYRSRTPDDAPATSRATRRAAKRTRLSSVARYLAFAGRGCASQRLRGFQVLMHGWQRLLGVAAGRIDLLCFLMEREQVSQPPAPGSVPLPDGSTVWQSFRVPTGQYGQEQTTVG